MSRLGRLLVRHPWIVYGVLAALAFPILEMLLHGERALQYAHDVFDDDVPRLFSIAADWRANGPVLWDPHLTSGNATLSQFALPPLAPDVILSFVVAPFTAYALNAAFMAFAAGVSMHLFLRDSLRLASIACFVGGIIATFAFWHYIYGYAALLLPLVLWSADRVMADDRRRRDVLVAVSIVAFLLLSSQIQLILIDGVATLAWVLVSRPASRSLGARVAVLVAIWGTAFLIAAPIIATEIVGIPGSQRQLGELTYPPLGPHLAALARLYGRVLLGVPTLGGLGGSADIYGTFFLGAIGLPLLVVGCVVPRRSGRERFLLALLVLIPLIDLLAPLAKPFQEIVSILESFQFVRVRHFLPVVLAINAAIGAAWLAGPDPIGRLGPRRRAVAAVGLAGVGLALAWQTFAAVRGARAATGSPVREEGWILGLLALLGGSIIVLAIGIVIVRRMRRDVRGQGLLVGGLAAILLVALTGERLAMTRAQRDLGLAMASWADRVALTPAQAFIASQPGGGRVLSIGEHANRALVAGLDAVDGYETIYPLRYHEVFGAMIAPQLALDPATYRYFHEWGNRAYAFGPGLDMDVANLLGVRWFYVLGDPLDDPSLTARFMRDGVTVYENAGAFPRTFIAHAASVLADRSAVIAALSAAPAEDLRDRVYFASADVPSGTAIPGVADAVGPTDPDATATIEADGIDRIGIRARSAAPGILVLADTYDPDWVADIDGTPVPILPVDGALRGIVLPAGEHLVTFRYRPIATYVGIVLALAAAVLLIAWLALGQRRRDRADPLVRPLDRASAPPS